MVKWNSLVIFSLPPTVIFALSNQSSRDQLTRLSCFTPSLIKDAKVTKHKEIKIDLSTCHNKEIHCA